MHDNCYARVKRGLLRGVRCSIWIREVRYLYFDFDNSCIKVKSTLAEVGGEGEWLHLVDGGMGVVEAGQSMLLTTMVPWG